MPEDRLVKLGKQYNRIWREAERCIVSYLRKLRHSVVDEASGKKITTYSMENIRDFYYAITCLKRIQEGRQAALSLEVKYGDEQQDNSTHLDLLQKEISRVLEKMQENDNDSSSTEDSL